MPLFRFHTDPLRYWRGPRFLAWFGVTFALTGLFTLWLSLGATTDPAGIVIGLIFFVVGTGIVRGRAYVRLDPHHQLIHERLSLFQGWRRKQHPFTSVTRVALRHQGRKSAKDHRYLVYTVELHHHTTIEVAEFSGFLQARRCAELFAQKLQVPLTDYSGDEKFVREPQQLHIGIQERLINSGRAVHAPKLQHIAPWVIQHEQQVKVVLPPYPPRSQQLIYTIATAFSTFVLCLLLATPGEIAPGAIIALVAAGLAFYLQRQLRRSLIIDTEQISLRQHWLWFHWSQSIKCNELEELRSVGRGRLLLCSDEHYFHIHALTRDEMRELSHLIRHWLFRHCQQLRA